MKQISNFRLIGSFLISYFVHIASGVHINVSPANPTESVDRSVEIKCTSGNASSQYSDILAVTILKDSSSQIAVLKGNSQISFLHNNVEQRFKATGDLSPSDASQTHLTLTLLLPRVEDTGDYSCVYTYLDTDGLPQQAKATKTLTVNEATGGNTYLEELVETLVRRVEALETANAKYAKCCSSGKGRK